MKPNRREFIQAASAATAVAIPAGTATAAQVPGFTPNKTPLKLGLMTYLVGQSWDIPTIIKNLKETKYEHVQLRTTHKHGVELTLTRQRAEVKQRFIDAGLTISPASTYRYHDADPAVVRRNIEGTKQFLQLPRTSARRAFACSRTACRKKGIRTGKKFWSRSARRCPSAPRWRTASACNSAWRSTATARRTSHRQENPRLREQPERLHHLELLGDRHRQRPRASEGL